MLYTSLKTVGRRLTSSLRQQPRPASPLFHALRCMSDAAPLTRDEIVNRVLEVLKGFDKIDKNKLKIDSRFTNDLGLDSLDVVEVVMAFEEEFDIEIPDKIADSIKTPEEAVSYIEKELMLEQADEQEH